jgi:hypothetical protein
MAYPMKITRHVFHCRLCDVKFFGNPSSGVTSIDQIAENLLANDHDYRDGSKIIHACTDQDIGIADLVGAKVEEVEG